ncbi:MAG: MobF family relaxase [Acidiferrobacteraceae bacterium]
MLSLKNLKSGGGGGAAVAAYCEHREAGNGVGYYSDGAPSAWHGRGAAALGLQGPVQRDDLVRVLEGHLPDGTDLSRRGNRQAHRRLGVDVTFSAPKSVSIVAMASGDERFLTAHDRAVKKALDFLEREVLGARRGKGGVEIEHTNSMLAATYRHEDARGVNGHVDMQLHTHGILVNATQRGDGTWSAMNLGFGSRNVLMHTADAVYKSELALDMQKLGRPTRVTKDGFELASVTDEQIKAFSARKNQIDEALAQRGLTREMATAHERSAANLATREAKKQTDHSDQKWAWREEARAAGIKLDVPRERSQGPGTDLSHESVKSATRHLSERETVFSRFQLRLDALRAGMGHADLQGVEREISQKSGGLIDVGGGQFSTRAALLAEHAILETARAGRGQAQALMTPEGAEKFIAAREQAQGFAFSPGQKASLALALTSPDKTFGIVGAAGTGKTTAMKPTVDAYRAAGYEIIGLAPITDAVRQLKSAGADDTRTMQSFLLADVKDPDTPRLIILDECGRVSREEMDRLQQKLAKMPGVRLLETGDYHQIGSVDAGSPFQQQVESGAIASAHITEVKRQTNPRMLEMAQALADRDVPKAIGIAKEFMHEVHVDTAHRNKRGELKATARETQAALADAAARNYLARDPERRERTLLMCGLNEVRRSANETIRAGLQDRGAIARDEIKIRALDKVDMTKEHRTLAESYTPGMVVRLDEGRGRERTTTDYAVARTDGERVILKDDAGKERAWAPHEANPKRMEVYESRKMALAVGDEIQIRSNTGNRRLDPENALSNGQTGKVVELSDQGPKVAMDDGRTITLDRDAQHCVDYSYCRTVAKTQGAEKTEALLVGEAGRVSSAQLANVGLTRGIQDLQVITDEKEKLAKSWEKTADRQCALEATRDQHQPDLSKLQDLRVEAAHDLGQAGDLARAREQEQAPGPTGHDRGLELER